MGVLGDTVENKDKINALKKVVSILEKYDIDYWLEFGTLLGLVREGRFIEHDSDIDIGVKNLEKIKKLEKEFNKENLFFYDGWNLKDLDITNDLFCIEFAEFKKYNDKYAFNWLVRRNIIAKLANTAIYLLKGNPHKFGKTSIDTMNKFIFLTNVPFKNLFIRFFTQLDYLFSNKRMMIFPSIETKKVLFLGINVRIPIKAEQHLLLNYGSNWKTPVKGFVLGGSEFEKRKNGFSICELNNNEN